MRLPTASSLDRATACAPSMALPGGVDRETDDNRRGTAIHRFLARARDVGRDRALAEIEDDELAAECGGIDLAAIPRGAEAEVTLAWNWRTDKARKLGAGLERDYSAADPDEFVGTADLVGVTAAAAWVDDYKTGAVKVRAARSMQLRFLGMAASMVAGMDAADVGMLYLGRAGKWRSDRAYFDALEIDGIKDELRALALRGVEAERAIAAGEPLRLHAGQHCEFCPALWGCPARAALLRTASAGDLDALAKLDGMKPEALTGMFVGQLEAMAPAQAGVAIDRVRLMRKILDAADDAGKELAKRRPGGVPLPGGRALKEVAWTTWGQTDVAKDEIKALKANLTERGEIRRVPSKQVRVVSDRDRDP